MRITLTALSLSVFIICDALAQSAERATAIAVDGPGNIIVTGYGPGSGTGEDIITIKYSSTGLRQWVRRYSSPGNNIDRATALVVDASANIYVTGWSSRPGTSHDYVTIKYNSSGVQQWSAEYDGSESHQDNAYAIAVDGSGNVFVTGRSESYTTDFDWATVKYNSSGIQQWVIRYTGTLRDEAKGVVVDGSGDVYVTGFGTGPFGRVYQTYKYSSGGSILWTRAYDCGVSGYDSEPAAIGIDPSGNIIVTGSSRCSGTGWDVATVKYSAGGSQLWAVRYNSGGSNTDRAIAMKIDLNGNVIVGGDNSAAGTSFDYLTLKYNSAGVLQWPQRYNGPANDFDRVLAVAVDGAGNPIVTGKSIGSGTGDDYVTIKYSSSGGQQWAVRYNGTGNAGDIANGIAMDGTGNIYVTGESFGATTDYDMVTIKYNSSGAQQWLDRYDGSPPDPSITSVSISTTSITLGEPFDIQVNVANNGGDSDDGDIAISFQSFDAPGDDLLVDLLDMSGDDNPGYREFSEGELIWHQNGYQFPAEYLLVDYADDNWTGGELNFVKLRVYPREIGSFVIKVRSAMGQNGVYFNEPITGPPFDQQGWAVLEYTVSVTAPDPPNLIYPPASGTDISTSLTFDWEVASGADSYHLQVSTEVGFNAPAIDQTGIVPTSYDVCGLLPSTQFYWRVGSVSGGWTSWSPTRTFYVGGAREVIFAGRRWVVKSKLTAGPGSNNWCDNSSSVWVDGSGWLHLKTRQIEDFWYSAEVTSVQSSQYGFHRFYTATRFDQLHQNIVAGLFLYEDAEIGAIGEIDVEVSNWNRSAVLDSVDYVVWDLAGNSILFRFPFPQEQTNTTHYFNWQEDSIRWRSIYGHYTEPPTPAAQIATQLFRESDGWIPSVTENLFVHMNLWFANLQGGEKVEAELVIADVELPIPTSISDVPSGIPDQHTLSNGYPNPFNPSTTIRYGLPHSSLVTLSVYNTLGQKVAQLVNDMKEAGYHKVDFSGDGLASGVYFYRLVATPLDGPSTGSGPPFVQTRKMILLR